MYSIDEFLAQITSLYRHQPRFESFCRDQVKDFVEVQNVLADMIAAFDLDKAVGVQLDTIGQWVGCSRHLRTPLTGVYFSWGTKGVGWQEGRWKGRYDPASGVVALADDAYRLLLRARIAANQWDGTRPNACAIWRVVFGEKMSIVIEDRQDMSMIVGIAGVYPDAVTKALLSGNYIPLKPSGVRIKFYAVSPNGGPLFCWGADSPSLGGWGKGSWSQNLVPM